MCACVDPRPRSERKEVTEELFLISPLDKIAYGESVYYFAGAFTVARESPATTLRRVGRTYIAHTYISLFIIDELTLLINSRHYYIPVPQLRN